MAPMKRLKSRWFTIILIKNGLSAFKLTGTGNYSGASKTAKKQTSNQLI